MKIASFERETALLDSGYEHVIGVDEAGRGPLAGPVVAAACVSREQNHDLCDPLWDFVRDSKTVSERKREQVYDFVLAQYYVGVGIVEPERIDQINILQATFEAMRKAIESLNYTHNKLKADHNVMILVDGNMIIPLIQKKQTTVAKGDSTVKCIAAASIVAKVSRDRIMLDLAARYPQYGFEKHKGYGTKMHMDALKTFGATPHHRKSFGIVSKF